MIVHLEVERVDRVIKVNYHFLKSCNFLFIFGLVSRVSKVNKVGKLDMVNKVAG